MAKLGAPLVALFLVVQGATMVATQLLGLPASSKQMCDNGGRVAARQGMEQPLTAMAEACEELARGMEANCGELRFVPFGDTCASCVRRLWRSRAAAAGGGRKRRRRTKRKG